MDFTSVAEVMSIRVWQLARLLMKLTRQFLCLTLALLCSATLASAIPGRAVVMKVTGNATKTDAKGSTGSLAKDMVLGTGDTITTGPGSTVDLNLGINGDFLRVDPDTTLKIDNLDIANVADRTVTTSLNIAKGSMTGSVVTKLTAASKYEIKSASGVAGIRGTVYSVRTDAAGKITRIVCTSGTVTFIDRGVTITIAAADRNAKAYTPPPAGTTPSQAAVGAPTRAETQTVAGVGALLQQFGAPLASDGPITVINNPSDVSVAAP